MSMNSKIGLTLTFLGTGTSHGVPVVDCMMSNYTFCPKGVCREAERDSKHRRTRSSILLSYRGKQTLIDVSADFREQMLRERVSHLDAVLFTHRHADHITGIPDIRSYSRGMEEGLSIYGTDETLSAIEQTFSYVFDPNTFVGGGIPQLLSRRISSSFTVNGVSFLPLKVEHGDCLGCVGYRFWDIAYIPDVKRVPPETLEQLRGVSTLIIDCLRIEKEHATHMILPEVKALAQKIGVTNIFLTHMCHDIHYQKDVDFLDENMKFAYDGLTLEL